MKIDITVFVLILVALKVFGVINWSWWIILLPIILVAGFLALIMIVLFVAIILSMITGTPFNIEYKSKKD